MKPHNTRSHTSPFPVARAENLIVQEFNGETLIYDKLTHKAFCLNATAALIWQACDGRNDANEITRRLTRLSDANVPCEVVHLGLQQLAAQNLLVEPTARTHCTRSRAHLAPRCDTHAWDNGGNRNSDRDRDCRSDRRARRDRRRFGQRVQYKFAVQQRVVHQRRVFVRTAV